MKETIHYLLMANHTMVKKELFARLRDTGLTLGQPKVLDYLNRHDGAIQKEVAAACLVDPASLTVILRGMEEKGLVCREMREDDRRAYTVRMTDRGREYARRIEAEFRAIEAEILSDFSPGERELLRTLLLRLYDSQAARRCGKC